MQKFARGSQQTSVQTSNKRKVVPMNQDGGIQPTKHAITDGEPSALQPPWHHQCRSGLIIIIPTETSPKIWESKGDAAPVLSWDWECIAAVTTPTD
ncbi:hypothetical protein U9M48_014568 [Paspalum notatum var. saurae]|uniref:Uncharacterized protein n=1 Tax=Paspalum notatum var. saurae TaxID=547442 RepID=A0AAQ3T1U4_PASNO